MAQDTQTPAFTAYVVTKRGEGRDDWWTPIGAAFPHKDGDGFNVVLQSLPLDGKIVLRPPKAHSDEPPQPAKDNVRSVKGRRER